MTNMNHEDAIRLGACEKYLLGDLAAPLREEFEDHYFECPDCARDLQAVSVMLAAAREVLRQSPVVAPAKAVPGAGRGWFWWLRHAVAVPAFAVLLLLLAYQSFVTVPQWKHLASQAASSNLLSPILLHPGLSRGAEPSIPVAPGQSFAVYLDIPAEPAYASYLLRLQDSSGTTRDLLQLSPADIQKAPLIKMPSNLAPGAYTILVLGQSQPGGLPSGGAEVARFAFLIANPANIEQH